MEEGRNEGGFIYSQWLGISSLFLIILNSVVKAKRIWACRVVMCLAAPGSQETPNFSWVPSVPRSTFALVCVIALKVSLFLYFFLLFSFIFLLKCLGPTSMENPFLFCYYGFLEKNTLKKELKKPEKIKSRKKWLLRVNFNSVGLDCYSRLYQDLNFSVFLLISLSSSLPSSSSSPLPPFLVPSSSLLQPSLTFHWNVKVNF